MTRAFEPNGEAKITVKLLWTNDDSWKEFTYPARITPKLVCTRMDRFARQTGRGAGRFNPHTKPRRLLAYRIGSGEWTDCGTPREEA